MKLLFENWRRYLNEGITDVVFYKRSISSAADTLKTDKFMTSVAFGTPSDAVINKGKLYYLSTMRSPTGEFFKPMPSVTFELDGRKLSEESKGAAVDYWGPDFPTDEMEDRVFTNKPYLEPASKYIIAIHVGMEIKSRHTMRITRIEEAELIENLAKSMGIPVYFYTDEKTFGILNKTKRLTLDQWKQAFEKVGGELEEPWGYKSSPYISKLLVDVAKLIDGLESGNVEDIEKGHESEWYRFKYDYGGERARQLANAIHGSKGQPESREMIDKVAQKMKSLGTSKIQDLVDWIKGEIKKHGEQK